PCIAVSQTSIAFNFHRPYSHRSLPSHPFPVLLRPTPSVGLARIAPFQTLMCVSLFDLATSACSFPCVAVFLSSILPQLCRAYDRAAIKFRGIDADINFNVSDYDEDIKQSQHCGKNFSRMKHCRVDTSHALRSSPWFRFPYPLQWGTPVFHWKMALVMCVVSVISSMDSVGSYNASSLLVASRPPTPGVLSQGIGLEGLTSVLAGLWGTGTGSTTITENVHTIAVTKMGSRRAVQLGAFFLIVLSLVELLFMQSVFTYAYAIQQLKLEVSLLQFLMSLFLVYSALCGQCLLHWACQTYGIVRLEALGISSLLGYHCHCFSLFPYLPTFNNMVSLQTPTCQC
ncbi:hypothetical protein S83_051617, partial [Arachis hypogaea]